MKNLFDSTSLDCSKKITRNYSTSFSLAINLLGPEIKDSIYAIYGFVRLADEIVDTFHEYDQAQLLNDFEHEYKKALQHRISLNPVLNAFQSVVHQFNMYSLVDSFLSSMKLDLDKKTYANVDEYHQYIYGSADVVGLMCLKVFVKGDENEYEKLKNSAIKLGSAFQKVNFLRDIKYDYENLGRVYFPNVNIASLDEPQKLAIIKEIENDFEVALVGIKSLPKDARLSVLVAYKYYYSLLKKIKRTSVKKILTYRVRVPDFIKIIILMKSYFRFQLNLY